MPPPLELSPEGDEDYISEEDSDFAPEAAAAEEVDGDSASEDDDDEKPSDGADVSDAAPRRRKRHAEDDADLGSGDEAIIEKAKKRQKKRKANDEEEDEGGEGGLIKTRSMRAVEKTQRQAIVTKGPVTVDVDALWAQMNSEPLASNPSTATSKAQNDTSMDTSVDRESRPDANKQPDTILIKRTYNFAGKVHSEEKLVDRDSAEAKLYLASLEGENGEGAATATESSPKKMPRKAFRSAFEPIPTDQALQRSDLNLGVSVRLRARELASEANAKKLNTVEKSRMDWAGYVDKEGIKDELELAGKSKTSYAARQDFLARSEAKREEDARRARLAGKVS